jgi:hypothetical protein
LEFASRMGSGLIVTEWTDQPEGVIALAFRLYETGNITPRDIGGMQLEWGDRDAISG